MLDETHIQDFIKNGFVVVENVLSEQEVNDVRRFQCRMPQERLSIVDFFLETEHCLLASKPKSPFFLL